MFRTLALEIPEKSSSDEIDSIREFYTFYEEHVIHLEIVMNRESAIQLVYQLTILLHNFLHFPVIELVFWDLRPGFPTVQWCLKLILQCISALLSAYSILSLPILVAEMQSLKERCVYGSFRRNFCILSKRTFQLLFHICSTYITIFLLMESDRFIYLRQYISGITEENLNNYGFIIYGLIIFLVFPLNLILENFFAVMILLACKSRDKVRNILTQFRKTLRIRVKGERLFKREKKRLIIPYFT